MKYLIYLLINLAALVYIDHRYNAELKNSYEATKEVLAKYCVPSAVLQGLKR